MATVIGNGEGVLPNEGIFHCIYKLPRGLLILLQCWPGTNYIPLLNFASQKVAFSFSIIIKSLRHAPKVTWIRKSHLNLISLFWWKRVVGLVSVLFSAFQSRLLRFWKELLHTTVEAAAAVCLEPLLATLARSQDCSNSCYKPFQLSRRRQTWRQSSKVWTSKEDKSFWLKKASLHAIWLESRSSSYIIRLPLELQ